MKKIYYSFLLILVCLTGCKENDDIPAQPFVAAFEKLSVNFASVAPETSIRILFSEPANGNGEVVIHINAENAAYDADFTTLPQATDNEITIPFSAGDEGTYFTFESLIYPYGIDDDVKKITFEIVDIVYNGYSNIQGYSSTVISFQTSLGAVMEPQLGGPNEGNQVFIDLSTEEVTLAQRDSWDLGFYSGEDFRVTINGSIYMAAAALPFTDIDAVTQSNVSSLQGQVAVGTFNPANEAYIDNPSGELSGTAIAVVSDNPEENKVYLINMGYYIGTTTPTAGSVAIAGDHRGWKKIRILKNGDGYLLQYANINQTTHTEVTITKNEAYNFTFFSIANETTVSVEPEKDLWDISFTVFTNIIAGAGSYGYSDFVLNNLKAGAKAYEVSTNEQTYEQFGLADIDDNRLQEDQRVIGADWRDVFTGNIYTDRFYVLKDMEGNYYKIKLLALLNESGLRGYPKFEYQLIN